LWVLRRRGPSVGHALRSPGRRHSLELGWGETVVRWPVCQLSGDMQTVVCPYLQGGTCRTLSSKLFKVRSALNGPGARAMTLDSTGTRKKCFEDGVHLLIGGLKHTKGISAPSYGGQAAGRLQ